MPQPPAQSPANVRNVIQTTNDSGPVRPPNQVTTASAILPVPLAPQLVGVDSAMFNVTFSGTTATATVTFPNLPQRNNTINPLNIVLASGNNLTIQPKDHLMFMAFIQGLTVTPNEIAMVNTTPVAIDVNNLRVMGPFLGSNTFQTFQADVSITTPLGFSGQVSGFVTGLLFLSIG